jgi:hypothetical protein
MQVESQSFGLKSVIIYVWYLFKVYDGISPSGTILAANLTGYSLPPAPYTTVETNQMSVVFDTDRNNAGLPFRLRPAKWQATFKVVP